MVSAGPKDEATMEIHRNFSLGVAPEQKETLIQLLSDLVNKVPGLELYKEKSIRLRTGEWLLSPDRFALIMSTFENK